MNYFFKMLGDLYSLHISVQIYFIGCISYLLLFNKPLPRPRLSSLTQLPFIIAPKFTSQPGSSADPVRLG